MSQRTLAIVGVVIFLSGLFAGVTLEKFDIGFSSSDEQLFSIEVDNDVGVNQYTLIEVDEGDNDEEVQITWVYHEFSFTSTGGENRQHGILVTEQPVLVTQLPISFNHREFSQ